MRQWGGGARKAHPEVWGLREAACTGPGSAPAETPGGCTYDPPCRWLEEADLQVQVPATLGNGTRLQLAGVPTGVLRRPGLRHFYCCVGCGKVFWEGSHLGRVASQFREVLAAAPGSHGPSLASSPPLRAPQGPLACTLK